MIQGPSNKADKKQVNETVAPGNATMLGTTNADNEKDIDSLLEKLDITRVKKAGLFLEDCCVFLSGFKETQVMHLSRVLKSSGANQVNQITSKVMELF